MVQRRSLKSEHNYKNGKKQGKIKYLEISGKVVFEAIYKDDKLVKEIINNSDKDKIFSY